MSDHMDTMFLTNHTYKFTYSYFRHIRQMKPYILAVTKNTQLIKSW